MKKSDEANREKEYSLTDFKEAIIAKGISRWPIHDCSMCGYRCGYVFNICKLDVFVEYDSGCHCTGRYVLRDVDLDDVKVHFDLQKHPEVISKYREFFGFQSKSQSIDMV